ncbi:MAG TPA: DUF962 domain-containing protein [Candidatus Dormibacteraeota bacterium]|nr:DUF962 domain-containing protein [Candidatus Dormibacteraeota bacterium]
MTEPMPWSRNFSEFWLTYVLAHKQPATRAFHLVGSLVGWGLFLAAIVRARPWLIVAALAVPYALAWFSHFFVEHNRPASFGHPLWSWAADQKMVGMMLIGRMDDEVRRCQERTV